jgi:hypothetical protein
LDAVSYESLRGLSFFALLSKREFTGNCVVANCRRRLWRRFHLSGRKDSQKIQEQFTSISKRFISMDLASVPWGTRRVIHFRGKMWMARQFEMSGLIAVRAISLGVHWKPAK